VSEQESIWQNPQRTLRATLKEDGIEKALGGVTDLSQVLAVSQD